MSYTHYFPGSEAITNIVYVIFSDISQYWNKTSRNKNLFPSIFGGKLSVRPLPPPPLRTWGVAIVPNSWRCWHLRPPDVNVSWNVILYIVFSSCSLRICFIFPFNELIFNLTSYTLINWILKTRLYFQIFWSLENMFCSIRHLQVMNIVYP